MLPCRFDAHVLFEVAGLVLSLSRRTRALRTRFVRRLELEGRLDTSMADGERIIVKKINTEIRMGEV